MVSASLLVLVAGLMTPAANSDSARVAAFKAPLPADVAARLQALRGMVSDSVPERRAQRLEESRRQARQAREQLLSSLPAAERVRLEATLKDMERLDGRRREQVRQNLPRFRE